jgi:hypothetical protein
MPINYKEYPGNWKTEIRPAVIERAKNRCEWCGVKNHSIIHRFGKGINDWEYWPEGMLSEAWTIDKKKSTKIILTIAHLDHDKMNHDVSIERLAALCQKCHLGYDAKHHAANRKYGRNHALNNLKLDL